jgi:hypothetical protein
MYQFLANASSSKYVMRLLALMKVSAGLLCEFFQNIQILFEHERRLVMWSKSYVAKFTELVTIANPTDLLQKHRDTNYLDNHRVQTYWQTTRTVYFWTGPN